MAIKTFTTGEVLTAADTNTYLANSGLVFVKTHAITGTPTTVTVTGAFSATYKSYLIQMTNVTHNAGAVFTFQLTGLTSGYYGNMIYANFLSGAPASAGYSNTSTFTHSGGSNGTNGFYNLTCLNPFLAQNTFMSSDFIDGSNAGRSTAYQSSSTSVSGFSISCTAGNFTGGEINVYGYRNG
jgi:hypothetical protein